MKRKLVVAALLLLVAGCQTRTLVIPNADPNKPPQTQKESRVDPNAAKAIEVTLDVGSSVAKAVDPWIGPLGGLIGGLLAGALAAWRKIMPTITQYKSQRDQYYAVASTSVTALDELKKMDKATWDNIKPTVEAMLSKFPGMSVADLDNIIRGLRGLPPVQTPDA